MKTTGKVELAFNRIYPGSKGAAMNAKDGIEPDRVVFMDEALACLRSAGMQAEIVQTPFEFQRGMTKMLK